MILNKIILSLPVFQYYGICCLGTVLRGDELIENDSRAPGLPKTSLGGPQSSQDFCPNTGDNSFTCGISGRFFCLAGHCSIYIIPIGGGAMSRSS